MKNVITVLTFCVALTFSLNLFSQTKPADIEECVTFSKEVVVLQAEAEKLKTLFASAPAKTDDLMKGMVEGGQIMQDYGDKLKVLSDKSELPCKNKLIEGKNQTAIVETVYLPLLPIVVDTYDFLVNIKKYAGDLGEGEFAKNIEQIMVGYTGEMKKLSEMCVNEVDAETCKPFTDKLSERLK